FQEYSRRYTDMPMLVRLDEHEDGFKAGRFLRTSELSGDTADHGEWKTVVWDENADAPATPQGSIGYRWDGSGRWNLEEKGADGGDIKPRLTLIEHSDDTAAVAFPYFGGVEHEQFTANTQEDVLWRKVPVKKITLADGSTVLVATVFDLMVSHYGVNRGLEDDNTASSYDDNIPY